MKYVMVTLLTLSLLTFTSCNQSKIDKLELKESQLEYKNKVLKSHIEDLENTISMYENHSRRYSSAQQSSMQQSSVQQNQREWHKQNAQQHLREAEFWRQNGNDFFMKIKCAKHN